MNSSLILNQPISQNGMLANARLLARASAAAYNLVAAEDAAQPRVITLCNSPRPQTLDASPIHSEPPYVGCYGDKVTDTHVTITEYDDCTVIAFRGTKDLRNWITDAEFQKRGLGSGVLGLGKVHAGFLAAANSVMPRIISRLRPQAPSLKPLPLVITGHSLGGALAVLCAWLLENQNVPVHSVYTFGQPRVGNRLFAIGYQALLGHRTFRFVNQNDLVPRLPGVLLGYRHAGQLAFINAAGSVSFNPSLVTLLTSDLLGLYRAYRQLDDVLITEHFVAAYIAALDGANRAVTETPGTEMKAPSTNIQAPEKHQIPNTNPRAGVWMLVLGVSLVFGAWSLVLLLSHPRIF